MGVNLVKLVKLLFLQGNLAWVRSRIADSVLNLIFRHIVN